MKGRGSHIRGWNRILMAAEETAGVGQKSGAGVTRGVTRGLTIHIKEIRL